MLLLHLTRLALAALSGVTPIAPARVVPAVVADSGNEAALTLEQLTRYMAVKKAVMAYWAAPAHASLLKEAKSTALVYVLHIGPMQQLRIVVFNYPALVKEDSALAAIFTTNNFAPEEFYPTHAKITTAAGKLYIAEVQSEALPAISTVLGKNVALVNAHRAELTPLEEIFSPGRPIGGDLKP